MGGRHRHAVRASRSAGSTSRGQGSRPWWRQSASRPAGSPGTPHDDAPIAYETSSSPNGTSSAAIGAPLPDGTATNASRFAARPVRGVEVDRVGAAEEARSSPSRRRRRRATRRPRRRRRCRRRRGSRLPPRPSPGGPQRRLRGSRQALHRPAPDAGEARAREVEAQARVVSVGDLERALADRVRDDRAAVGQHDPQAAALRARSRRRRPGWRSGRRTPRASRAAARRGRRRHAARPTSSVSHASSIRLSAPRPRSAFVSPAKTAPRSGIVRSDVSKPPYDPGWPQTSTPATRSPKSPKP